MNKRRARCQLENLLRRFSKGEASQQKDSSEQSGDKGEVERGLRCAKERGHVRSHARASPAPLTEGEVGESLGGGDRSAEVQGVLSTAFRNRKTIS